MVSFLVQYSLGVSSAKAENGDLRQNVFMLVKDGIAQWHLINMYPLFNTEFGLIVSSAI